MYPPRSRGIPGKFRTCGLPSGVETLTYFVHSLTKHTLQEDRAVSMLTKNTRRIEAGDLPDDVQVFNYNPRTGEDGQFRLFNYQHSPRGIPSETPRRGQDAGELRHSFDKNSHLFHPFHPPSTPRGQMTPFHIRTHSKGQSADISIP
jgi:hypothetical protein